MYTCVGPGALLACGFLCHLLSSARRPQLPGGERQHCLLCWKKSRGSKLQLICRTANPAAIVHSSISEFLWLADVAVSHPALILALHFYFCFCPCGASHWRLMLAPHPAAPSPGSAWGTGFSFSPVPQHSGAVLPCVGWAMRSDV